MFRLSYLHASITNCLHKGFILQVPQRMAISIPPIDNALHVVCEYVFRHSQPLESMQHTDKKVLLLGIREELYKPFPAVMTYHSKAGCPVRCVNICFDLDEAPVHLIALAWIGLVSAPQLLCCATRDRLAGIRKR